eukprot:Selendium_serpulae@DN6928_c1_g1_i1.p1
MPGDAPSVDDLLSEMQARGLEGNGTGTHSLGVNATTTLLGAAQPNATTSAEFVGEESAAMLALYARAQQHHLQQQQSKKEPSVRLTPCPTDCLNRNKPARQHIESYRWTEIHLEVLYEALGIAVVIVAAFNWLILFYGFFPEYHGEFNKLKVHPFLRVISCGLLSSSHREDRRARRVSVAIDAPPLDTPRLSRSNSAPFLGKSRKAFTYSGRATTFFSDDDGDVESPRRTAAASRKTPIR